MTLRFLVVDVFVAGVFDVYILRPIEAWLRMGEADNMESTGETEAVGGAGDPHGREGGRALIEGGSGQGVTVWCIILG